MTIRRLLIAGSLLALVAASAPAQTYKPDFATQIQLASSLGADPSQTITLKAPNSLSSYQLILPAAAPTAGYVLAQGTDGGLVWTNPSSGLTVTLAGDVSGLSNATTINNTSNAGNHIVAALNSPADAKSLDADVLNYDATLKVTSNALGLNLAHANAWAPTSGVTSIQGASGADILELKDNGGTTQFSLLSDGTINVSAFSTAGVVHNLGGASSGNLTSSLLVDADVKSDAAIAGTKISPNFGAQTITTGTSTSGNPGSLVIYDNAGHAETFSAATDLGGAWTYTLPSATGTLALLSDITGGGGAGSFSTLTSSSTTQLATGDNLTNSFGTGAAALNTIGNTTGTTTINGDVKLPKLTAQPGVVHNSATGLLSSGGIATTDIIDANVTYAKIQTETPSTLLGNPTTATTQSPSEISLDPSLKFVSGTPNKLALNTANSNAWSGQQAFGSIVLTKGATPVDVTSAAEGGMVLGTANTYIPITSTAAASLGGITDGLGTAGRIVELVNVGSFQITLKDAKGGVTAPFAIGGDAVMLPGGSATFMYTGTAWEMIASH